MGAALSALGLGAAYWNRHALFKFIMIAAIVMIICYVIVISTRMEEKYWPPVFMGGILALGGYYMIEAALAPKPQTWTEYFSGMLPSFSDDGDYVAPEAPEPDRSNNPWANGSISDDSGWGGKRRRPKRSK